MHHVVALAVCALALVACKAPEPAPSDLASATEVPLQLTLAGAGPAALAEAVTRWAGAWHDQSGHRVTYKPVGSATALRQVQARELEFACIDSPLAQAELDRLGLQQFPIAAYGVVPIVHLPGAPTADLLLDGATLAAMYLGEITRWDDARIAALNPDLPLPATEVVAVHCADEAGTTWVFSGWLARVSPVWRGLFGRNRVVPWTSGVGVKGDAGVAEFVARVPGSIGYVSIGYVSQVLAAAPGTRPVRLRNAVGNDVGPSYESVHAAAAGADWRGTPGFAVEVSDDAGGASWPIVGAAFGVVPRSMPDRTKATAVLSFFAATLRRGDLTRASRLVPLDEGVAETIERSWTLLKSRDASFWPPAP